MRTLIVGLLLASILAFAQKTSTADAGKTTTTTVKEDPAPSEVKSLSTELSKGNVPDATVFKAERSDGGFVYVSKSSNGTVIYLDDTPCARRPKGAAKSSCTLADGGDPGDENTMQNGQWKGAGCVKRACVILAGEKE